MQSAVSYRFHQVAEQAAGFFLPVLGDMEVNLLGGFIVHLAYPVHDFVEGGAGFGQQGDVGVAEDVGSDTHG